MRMVFLTVIVVLFQLCAYAVGRGLFWLIEPYLPSVRALVLAVTFVVSNVFLATLFFGQFRWGMGYLAVLWFGVLTMLIICAINAVLHKFGLVASVTGLGSGIRLLAVLTFSGLLGLSIYHAYTPTVRHLDIQLDKPMAHPVRLAMVSDLHLGSLFGSEQLDRLAHILSEQKVDLLLMPGDIMDDDTEVYEAEGMQASFAGVVGATTSGVVASLGNHDLYDEDSRLAIAQAVRATGALLLDDQVSVVVANGVPLSIIGRYDDHVKDRKTTAQLFEQLPMAARQNPVILLDHRPSQIDDNIQLPIDVQVSGHTHNGQVFPANFIVKMINRVAYGHAHIDGTHIIVSSGYGFWGIPFRLGSQSEVWVIEMRGKD